MLELIAHRGACFEAPENSLEAFELAIGQGADRLELDVRATRDGVPVVCHDASTARTADLGLRVAESRLAELREVMLANGEPVPTLEEVCELARGRIPLDVELKDGRAATVTAVLALLARYELVTDALVTSFEEPPLLALRRGGYRGRLGLVVGSRSLDLRQRAYELWPMRALARVDATDLVIHYRLAHPVMRLGLRRSGRRLVLWTSLEDEAVPAERRRAIYRRVAACRPDGLISARLREARAQLARL
jgi:glycerophosphoryl diester phosphodiesterase